MSKKKNKSREQSGKLSVWQERLKQADNAWLPEVSKMEEREAIYNGSHEIVPPSGIEDYPEGEAPHVRNIIFENIESEVDSNIPMPKVVPVHEEDEHLAEIIEHYIRNELDRMPFERINDQAERTVPIQGGIFYYIDWDNNEGTHDTVGAVTVRLIHPKQLAPQPGVAEIDEMDWIIVKIPTTKTAILRRYGIDVNDESESEPQIRSATGNADSNEDEITLYIGYEKDDNGNINRYAWVNDTELEELKDYQARRQPVCRKCKKMRPLPGQVISNSVDATMQAADNDDIKQRIAGQMLANRLSERETEPDSGELMPGIEYAAGDEPKPQRYDGGACPWCGSREFDDEPQEFEQIMLPIMTSGGVQIPGAVPGIVDGVASMVPTLVPYYKPGRYPIITQRNVSVYGQLLGNSDVDAIKDQQNTLNILNRKVIDRLIKAGSRITLPDRADIKLDPRNGEVIYIANAADASLINTYDFSGNLQFELAYMAQVYEEARQILGITDSYQGRRDTTAQSGKAKEIAAAQSAGRLESKRVMKNAAYADIFRQIFHYALAYTDEPRPVSFTNEKGETKYEEFNRYDFVKQDAEGNYYWNDEFLFSVDAAGALNNNRESLWRETRENLATGAFGDPAALETLILFWTKMEEYHYPGAGSTKKYLEARLEEQRQIMEQQSAMQQSMMPMPGAGASMGGTM